MTSVANSRIHLRPQLVPRGKREWLNLKSRCMRQADPDKPGRP
jgi:hypothetical protein